MRTNSEQNKSGKTLSKSNEISEEHNYGNLTLSDCLSNGSITRDQIEDAIIRALEDAFAVQISADVYATLPQFGELPTHLKDSLIEICLLARV